jgi:hypothetical protein
MKKLIFLVSCVLLFGCHSKIKYDGQEFDDYNTYVEYSINHLKSPVVITNIRTYTTRVFVNDLPDTIRTIVIKDSVNTIKVFNSRSELINIIAATKNVGDTIR